MLWLFAALALLFTWFISMPTLFFRLNGAAQALKLTVKTIPTVLAALFGLAALLKSGGTGR